MSGEKLEFFASGGTCQGYLATPAKGSGPGVVVLQEWWGLVPHIRDVTDRFAAEGFVALAPDLYHGESATGPDQAGRRMMQLNVVRAEKDLAGAVRAVARRSSTKKIGIIGFCMGGQLALFAACKNPEIGACADYYGIHPNVQPDLAGLAAPFLGIFAEKDAYVTPAQARELEGRLKAANKRCEFHIYPGVDHAFFNDSRPDVYNAAAAKQAWQRTLAFFRENLA